MYLAAALCSLVLLGLSNAQAPVCNIASSQVLWRSDFSKSTWLDPWKATSKWFLHNAVQYKDSTTPALRVYYPTGSYSPSNAPPEGGAGWKGKNISPRDSVYLYYQLKFHSNFNWVKGGKLPGLYGGAGNSGGDAPDGTDGWSARFMWRANGAGEVYTYTTDTNGASLGRGSWTFSTSGWHKIQQYIKLNTPGKKDGIVTVWYDGKQVYHNTTMNYRTVSTLKIDGIMFSTFFGGSSSDWATPVNTYTYYYDFILSGSKIPC